MINQYKYIIYGLTYMQGIPDSFTIFVITPKVVATLYPNKHAYQPIHKTILYPTHILYQH